MRRLAVLALVALCGCPPKVKPDPELVARRARIKTVAIMPPDLNFVRKVFRGDDEPLAEDMDAVRRRLPELLRARLEGHGYTVKPARLEEADLAAEPDLRYQTTLVVGRYRTGGTPQTDGAKPSRLHTLGPEVSRFADHAGVDGLIFADMAGWKKSKGEIARDVAVSVMLLGNVMYHTQAGALRVALVDGTNGDILWWNLTTVTGSDFAGGALDGMVQAIFSRLPPR